MADTINLESSQKIISIQGLNHYHEKAMTEVDEKIAGVSGAVVDDSLSATSTNAIQNKAVTNALNAKANLTDIPSSLPASGGDASTVNGHTVNADVPANAKFTDTNTTYSAGTGISISGTTISNSGVRSVASGSANGTISVNTGGTAANVAVKGLASAAYQAVQTAAGTVGLHRISSGTAAATTTNCPAGCWYGKHD